MDVSIAGNEWGIYAAASSSLRGSDPAAWLGPLMVLGRSGRPPHARNLFLDLRDLGGEALSAALAGALTSAVTQAGIGRCTVLVSGMPCGRSLLDSVRRDGEQAGLRILVTDGRDRPVIAAGYQWILNGREPSGSLRTGDGGAAVLPFPRGGNAAAGKSDAAHALRRAG